MVLGLSIKDTVFVKMAQSKHRIGVELLGRDASLINDQVQDLADSIILVFGQGCTQSTIEHDRILIPIAPVEG